MFGRYLSKIEQGLFRIRNRNKVKIGSHCKIVNTSFEGKNSVADGTKLINCHFGIGSYISKEASLSYVKVGRFCSIADSVSVCLGNHPINYVSTHPAFYYNTESQIGWSYYQGEPLFKDIYRHPIGENYYQIVIGNDVWIGSHALLMGGVRIGDGAIIAAGAVVTKDVEPYAIVGGVPAKLIKKRFSDSIINSLLKIGWWDKSYSEIERNKNLFIDIDNFIRKYND